MNTFPSNSLRQDVSVESLKKLSRVQLSILHRELSGDREPTRFRLAADAVAKVTPLLRAAIKIIDTPVRDDMAKINYRYHGHVTKYRSNTRNGRAIDLMRRPGGATPQECMVAGRWDYKQLRHALHHINKTIGLGIQEGDDGRLRAHADKEGHA